MAEGGNPNDESIIANFVKNNQSLFAVMGIFGALSVYLTQMSFSKEISESDKYSIGFGVAASLFLFVLFCWLILFEMFRLRKQSKESFFFESQNFEYIVFAIPFSIVAITIISFVAKTLSKQISGVIFLITYTLGGFIYFYILKEVYTIKNKSLKWCAIISGIIVIIVPIILIIINQSTFYMRTFLFIMPIMSSMAFCAIIFIIFYILSIINTKFGFSKWIIKQIKYFHHRNG